MRDETTELIPLQYYDLVKGRPGSPWIEVVDTDGPELQTYLVNLDGTRRVFDAGFFETTPDEGGLWTRSDTEVSWLADGATTLEPIALEPGFAPRDLTPMGDGRIAVLWSPQPPAQGPDDPAPFLQIYGRP